MSHQRFSRRSFVVAGSAGGAAALLGGGALASPALRIARTQDRDDPATPADTFPAQDPSVVQEIVRKSHFDLDGVRTLVTASPALAKASWDWGFGDWESALGAASHVGRPDIAQVLIDHGARPNLFTATMLGHLAVVRAFVEASPGVQKTPGPHGITLLSHAKAGGETAAAVVEYLEQVGDADIRATSLPLTDAEKQVYLGQYVYGPADDERIDIIQSRGGTLSFQRPGRVLRQMRHLADHTFSPAGARSVRITFAVKDGRAASVTVHDPDPIVVGRRE